MQSSNWQNFCVNNWTLLECQLLDTVLVNNAHFFLCGLLSIKLKTLPQLLKNSLEEAEQENNPSLIV